MTHNLWKPAQTAEFLAVTTETLANWRERGTGPRFVQLAGHAIRYRPSDIEKWLEASTSNQ